LFLAKPLRESAVTTGPGFLGRVYGNQTQVIASISSSVGIFLNIIGQVLSAVALLTSMFGMNPLLAALIAVVLIISYVIFGGVWGAGYVGLLKLTLIYVSLFITGILAYSLGGGMAGFKAHYPAYPWFSLFGRGASTDLATGFSLFVGVISTQTYLQAILSSRNIRISQRGAVISGLIIPPVGIASIFVGLYMRANFPLINAKEALPLFVLNFLPDWLGGIVLATLLVSIIGTGAGLVLGVSTMLTHDIYKRFAYPTASDRNVLIFSKLAIIIVSTITLIFVNSNINSLILKWSVLSMGLRGTSICLPLLYAIFFRNFVKPSAGTLAVTLGPLSAILWAFFGSNHIDPLYPGLLISFVFLTFGSYLSPH
jgi:SSS family solute:Na+ symporter